MPASSRPDAIITANAGASAPVLANGASAPVTAPVTVAPGAAVNQEPGTRHDLRLRVQRHERVRSG